LGFAIRFEEVRFEVRDYADMFFLSFHRLFLPACNDSWANLRICLEHLPSVEPRAWLSGGRLRSIKMPLRIPGISSRDLCAAFITFFVPWIVGSCRKPGAQAPTCVRQKSIPGSARDRKRAELLQLERVRKVRRSGTGNERCPRTERAVSHSYLGKKSCAAHPQGPQRPWRALQR
jgi:hypothetical protein